MADYSAEEEQLEKLKLWWQENRNYVIAGVALGLMIVLGWRGWESHTRNLAEQGSLYYEQLYMAIEQQDLDEARRLGQVLREDTRRTPYAALGSMLVARAALEAGEVEQAREYLQWASDNARSRELRSIARLRLARLSFAMDEPEAALELVRRPPLAAFASHYAELRGDILLDMAREQEAREAYAEALDAMEPGLGDRQRLQMKIDSAGGPPR